MLNTLLAIAFSAVMAATFVLLPEFAPRVEAGDLLTLQKSGLLHVVIVEKDCSGQTWPNYSTSCLRGHSAKLETRRVVADRS
jgi:hypothetical protein